VLSICDARLFPGRLRVLNPLVRAIYEPTTGWRPERDLVGDIARTFGNVEVESFNGGSFFIATARRV
jgi:demethylmenaquinone methyltransferase/2-methoxy-6-polyprenyl-1,4-benzoquinol methylase